MTTIAPPKVERLLDAALELFWEYGYAATPVPNIAARASIAVGSVYRHFPSKEHLVNALYRREKQRMLDAVLRDVDPHGDPEATFRKVWQRLAEFAADDPTSLSFVELHHHEAYLDEASRAMAAEGDRAVAQLLRSWQHAGAVRSGDPDLLHAQVFGGFVAVVRHQLARREPITPAIGSRTVDAAWGLLAVPKGTP